MKKIPVIIGSVLLVVIVATSFVFGGSAFGQATNEPSANELSTIEQATGADTGRISNLVAADNSSDGIWLAKDVPLQSEPNKVIKLAATTATADKDVQLIEAIVGVFSYPAITVEVNKPVRINFKVSEADLNACNNEILIPEWNIKKALTAGDNFVEFTPTKTGSFTYTCWMDMIRGTITVTAAAQTSTTPVEPAPLELTPVVPTEQPSLQPSAQPASDIVAATVVGDVTAIEAKIAPGGYPQIIVEANKPVRINFKADAADINSCNDEIVIPEWNIRKPLSAGDNFVEFTPTKTGTFYYSCWMGMIQSSITVIEQGSGDIGALPLDESANTPTGCGMMSWFGGSATGSTGGGCCGGR